MAEDILERLAAHARERVGEAEKRLPRAELRKLAEEKCREEGKAPFLFEKALSGPGLSVIAECKKASPSKGLIAPDFPYLEIAKDYEKAGASAISVLTEPKWFLGSDRYLEEISEAVKIPVLRKDFTVDAYMIYEARLLGASAVLLIVAILGEDRLSEYLAIADSLGLSALVEAHDEREIETAVSVGARVIGVNNRNLRNFSVDIGNAGRLRALCPEGILFVAESGIKTRKDVTSLLAAGADACLVGESLMRAEDKTEKFTELFGRGPAGIEV